MLRLYSAHMPDKSLSVVAGIYQNNPAVPHNDRIHSLQECLSPGLSPLALGFKVIVSLSRNSILCFSMTRDLSDQIIAIISCIAT